MVTVFTPTYNRAHLLPNLYKSLQDQTCKDFEWIIVDDGSKDDTEDIVRGWMRVESSFLIRYYKVPNGGKMRAINYGASLAEGVIFCGIDSDDWFCDDAISSIIDAFKDIESEKDIVGVSFAYNKDAFESQGMAYWDYIDCKNYERSAYGLVTDRILVFYTDIMRKYRIPVWEDEKFTPESVFIDQMALDGYKMRYFTRVIYRGEYHNDGLTAGSWRLLRDNPMGYAMMYNVQMQYHKGIKQKMNDILQFISCCCIKGEYRYILNCYYCALALLLFIPGLMLAQRRAKQIKKYCTNDT